MQDRGASQVLVPGLHHWPAGQSAVLMHGAPVKQTPTT